MQLPGDGPRHRKRSRSYEDGVEGGEELVTLY